MARPTEEEKDRFLEYIRAGDDRATAAWRINPDYTGSMFRSMCNLQSPRHYDEEFAIRYEEAIEVRGPLDPDRQQIVPAERRSSSMTSNGALKSMHLTEDMLDEFLEMIRDGVKAYNAAQDLDPPTSMTQINRRAAKDPDFAREFREAMEEGYATYKDKLRAEAERQAMAGDYRALRDQMLMHLEEAKVLTTNRLEVGGLDGAAIKLMAEKHFPNLPDEMLETLIKTLEDKEFGPRELTAGEG